MNILPKKSWHVRNKDNIERVRRDEEKAAQEEKEKLRRIALAESEARTEQLRHISRQRLGTSAETAVAPVPEEHINFFQDEEKGKKSGGNEEYEREKKEEKEKHEKALGILTYLGQSAAEAQTAKPWYLKRERKQQTFPPSMLARDKVVEEYDLKGKNALDPMNTMMKCVNVKRKVDGGGLEEYRATSFDRRSNKASHSRASFPPSTSSQSCSTVTKSKKRKRRDSSESSSSSSSSSSDSSSDSSSSSDSDSDEPSRKKHKKKQKKSKHKKSKHKKSKKRKKEKKHKSKKSALSKSATSGGSKTIAQLRAERLRRETEEKKRREGFLAKMRGEKTEEDKKIEKEMNDRERGYHSQFNPELVRRKKKKKDIMDIINEMD